MEEVLETSHACLKQPICILLRELKLNIVICCLKPLVCNSSFGIVPEFLLQLSRVWKLHVKTWGGLISSYCLLLDVYRVQWHWYCAKYILCHHIWWNCLNRWDLGCKHTSTLLLLVVSLFFRCLKAMLINLLQILNWLQRLSIELEKLTVQHFRKL